MRMRADVEIRLVVVAIAGLESDSDSAFGRDGNERRDVKVVRPASDLTGVVNRASEGAEYGRAVREPLRQLLELRSLARVEGVAHCDRMRWNFAMPLESISGGIDAEWCDLLPNPPSGLDERASMQTILHDWLVRFRDDQQRKIRRPEADAEWLASGDYPRNQSREGRDPFQVRVTVVGPGFEEGDSRCAAELCSMVQLQTRVGEVRALFRTDCLPSPGVGRSGARFLRLKFHKYIPVRSSSSIRALRASHKQTGTTIVMPYGSSSRSACEVVPHIYHK